MGVSIYKGRRPITRTRESLRDNVERKSLKYGNSSNRRIYEDDFDDDDFYNEFDDDIEEVSEDEEEITNKEILEKLEIVLEKLAKLEKVIYSSNNKQEQVTEQMHTPSIPSNFQVPSVGMMGEVSSVLRSQGGVGVEMYQNRPLMSGMGTMSMTPMIGGTNQPAIQQDVVTSIATMPTNMYDDAIPNIIGVWNYLGG